MEECRKLIFKLWFKNGMYIEKEVEFGEDTPKKDIEDFFSRNTKVAKRNEGLFQKGYRRGI